MSASYFANHLYGIVLDAEVGRAIGSPTLDKIVQETFDLCATVVAEKIAEGAKAGEDVADLTVLMDTELNRRIQPIVKEMKRCGIQVPRVVRLWYTGLEEDRVDDNPCPAEEVILGWGFLGTFPGSAQIPPSFSKLASHHMWVTGSG